MIVDNVLAFIMLYAISVVPGNLLCMKIAFNLTSSKTREYFSSLNGARPFLDLLAIIFWPVLLIILLLFLVFGETDKEKEKRLAREERDRHLVGVEKISAADLLRDL